MADPSYNFQDAFNSAFPKVEAPPATDYGSALANSGVQREVTTMTMEAMGSTVSATPGTNPPPFELISGKTTPGGVPSSVISKGVKSPGSLPSQVSTGRRKHDPHGDYNFIVTIDGCEAGAFQKCEGLSFEVDLIEYRDSMSPYPMKRPGIKRFGNLRLTKGHITNGALWDWCQAIMEGKIERKNGSIQVLADTGDAGAAVVTYNFLDAWPVKWSGLRLDGKGTGSLLEEIELAVECVMRA